MKIYCVYFKTISCSKNAPKDKVYVRASDEEDAKRLFCENFDMRYYEITFVIESDMSCITEKDITINMGILFN